MSMLSRFFTVLQNRGAMNENPHNVISGNPRMPNNQYGGYGMPGSNSSGNMMGGSSGGQGQNLTKQQMLNMLIQMGFPVSNDHPILHSAVNSENNGLTCSSTYLVFPLLAHAKYSL